MMRTSTRWLSLLVLLAGVLASLPPVAAAAPKQRKLVRTLGQVTATATWREEGFLSAADVRLTIARGGQAALARRIRDDDGRPSRDRPTSLAVVDLDGDGEPEVLLDLYTGGAHCCTHTLLFGFDPPSGRYVSFGHDWGNVGYGLEDVDGDGLPEFRSADDRFSYQFAAYAFSARPLQVWEYRPGALVDTTLGLAELIRADARAHWRAYLRERRRAPRNREVRGLLAAWQADQALLGELEDGWATLRGARARGELHGSPPWPSGYRFLRELRAFLVATGYLVTAQG
jgi:hypothetical protein